MVMNLKNCKIRIIDSWLFLDIPLRSFSSTVNLPETKGYFCYGFMTEDALDYVGPLSGNHFFQPDNLLPEKLDDFERWYEAQKLQVFDLQLVLTNYEYRDVKLLGFDRFSELFIESVEFDLLGTNAITLPGAITNLFLSRHVKPNTIAIVPSKGYRGKHSTKALKWIAYMERKLGVKFQTCRSLEGEFYIPIIPPYHVDDFYADPEIILDFYGCYFHSCEIHTNHSAYNKQPGATNLDIYRKTLDLENDLKKLRPIARFISIWEPEYDDLMRDPETKTFLDSIKLADSLKAREAIRGGRVENLSFSRNPLRIGS